MVKSSFGRSLYMSLGNQPFFPLSLSLSLSSQKHLSFILSWKKSVVYSEVKSDSFLYCCLRGDQNIGCRKRLFRLFGSSLEARSHLKALLKNKLSTTSMAPSPGGIYILSFTIFWFCGLIWIYDTSSAVLWITSRRSTVYVCFFFQKKQWVNGHEYNFVKWLLSVFRWARNKYAL